MRKLENVLKELKVVFEHHIVKEFNSDGYVCKYSLNPWHTWHDIEEVIRKHIDGDWIPVKERLPEEWINPITNDFYEYQVTAKFGESKFRKKGKSMLQV